MTLQEEKTVYRISQFHLNSKYFFSQGNLKHSSFLKHTLENALISQTLNQLCEFRVLFFIKISQYIQSTSVSYPPSWETGLHVDELFTQLKFQTPNHSTILYKNLSKVYYMPSLLLIVKNKTIHSKHKTKHMLIFKSL